MMETKTKSSKIIDNGDGQDIEKSNFNNVPIKHEFISSDNLDPTIKVENNTKTGCGVVAANLFKTKLPENLNSAENLPRIVARIEDIKLVKLEKILKVETEIVRSDVSNTSYPIRQEVWTHNDSNNSDSSDTEDPECDPFANINCDPSFSLKPPSLNNKLQCKLCLETQDSEIRLHSHMKICVTSHENRRRFCVRCNLLLSSVQRYKFHALKIHGIEVVSQVRPLKCGICSRSYAHKESFAAHCAKHQEQASNPPGTGTGDDATKRKPIKCTECTASFRKISNLTYHMRTHKNERPFKCPILDCGKTFKFNGHLKDHHRLHFNSKPFECPQLNCLKKFKHKTSLKAHLVSFAHKK